MRPSARTRQALALSALAAALVVPPALAAQPLDEAGAVATGLLLRRMDGVKRVLMIGAHPDDEDSSLLAALARGWGAETAYLSLTRGDGGQNLIGPELWEGLGVIRTGELEAARALDGGRQFFTRAFDYGFSKSADEALAFWPREELLRDVVWVVRTFRPQVIVSVFSGTPRDGHGQHQAAGIMAREAFEAAGDPTRFPEQIAEGVEAWAPAKLYQSARRFGGGVSDAAELTVETGVFDPLLGRSWFQLSMDSRSQHRSQDMGAPQPPGPRQTGVELIDSRVAADSPELFAGIDTTLVGLTEGLDAGGALAAVHLSAYREAIEAARHGLGLDPEAIAPDLAEALAHLRAAQEAAGSAADAELSAVLSSRIDLAERAYLAARGIVVEVRAGDDLVVPGQTAEVSVRLWNGSARPVEGARAALEAPPSWTVRETGREGVQQDGSVEAGALATWTYEVRLAADAEPSSLYYLERERDGAMYRWPDDPELRGLPRDPAPVYGRVELAAGEAGVAIERAESWRYVGVDPARGEFEKSVLVVPPLSVRAAPGSMVWPVGRREPRTVSVAVRSESPEALSGEIRLEAPVGWRVFPEAHPYELDREGAERTFGFEVAPAGELSPGASTYRAVARTAAGAESALSATLVDYEHIERTVMLAPAAVEVSVVPVRIAEGLRVGYVMGSGDDGPDAIRQLGAEVVLLDEERVRAGNYESLDVVVLGVRAYETRPDLQAASAQLLDFARAGGTVIAQYNRGTLGALAPYPLEVGRGSPRVSDETASVRLLRPDAPVYTSPNAIAAEDFSGWVQERGLYFASEWDAAYTPLIEMNDPGEEPTRGSLLVAQVGEGLFVYTGLSFFRQWSEGVPGAYRLFANLLSLDGSGWSSFAAGAGAGR